MASLSLHERYGGSRYAFEWRERKRWIALLQRFHCTFGATWAFGVQVVETKAFSDMRYAFDAKDDVVTGLRTLEAAVKNGGYKVTPRTNVAVVVRCNGFWGAMPRKIDWQALPAWPKGAIPATVALFAQKVRETADMVGCYYDIMLEVDFSAFKEKPIDTAWFSFIIGSLRGTPEKYTVTSLYYAPSTESMYVMVKTPAGKEEQGTMIVRFDTHSADYAADPTFDIDEGFADTTQVSVEMRDDFRAWVEKGRPVNAEVLQLRAPFDKMSK